MNRVVTAFLLIAVIIAYSTVSVFVIHRESAELTAITDSISEYNKNGDTANASAAAEELTEKWLSFEKKMSVFVSDERLGELSKAIAKIPPYITAANDELNAELENVRRQLWLVYRSELPVWYNIL